MAQSQQLFFRCKSTGMVEPALQGWAFMSQRTCQCGATIPDTKYWDHWDKETHTAPKGVKRWTPAWDEWLKSIR